MDINSFERRLTDRRNDLTQRMGRIEADLEATPDQDLEDQAINVENDEVLEEMGQVSQEEVRAIDAALARIKAGTFGKCAKCGNPISEARLDAVPHAALCEECISDR